MDIKRTSSGWIRADWPAAANISAGSSTRDTGCDDLLADFASEPKWLHQVHGTQVVSGAFEQGLADGRWRYRYDSGGLAAAGRFTDAPAAVFIYFVAFVVLLIGLCYSLVQAS